MFQVTILKDYELVDSFETDCIIGTAHDTKTDDYAAIFYADCDDRTAARTLRAEMQNVNDHLTDELLEAAQEDDTHIAEVEEDLDDKGVN